MPVFYTALGQNITIWRQKSHFTHTHTHAYPHTHNSMNNLVIEPDIIIFWLLADAKLSESSAKASN